MKKDLLKLYEQIKYLVCDYSELNENEVLLSNREECVDARYIMVGVLSNYFTDDEIAKFTGLTRACANKIRNGMKAKMSRLSFRSLYYSVVENIQEWAEINLKQINNV